MGSCPCCRDLIVLSQTCRYAIRSLAFIATAPDEWHEIRGLAEAVGIPANYLSKLLGRFSKTGLLESRKGRGGGYRFARNPAGVHLREVVALVDGTERSARCAFGLPECCDDNPCPLHDEWKLVKEGFEAMLSTRTFGDIAAHPRARPDR